MAAFTKHDSSSAAALAIFIFGARNQHPRVKETMGLGSQPSNPAITERNTKWTFWWSVLCIFSPVYFELSWLMWDGRPNPDRTGVRLYLAPRLLIWLLNPNFPGKVHAVSKGYTDWLQWSTGITVIMRRPHSSIWAAFRVTASS